MKKLIDFGDKTAIILSILCTIHCLAAPFILILLPSITSLLAFDLELVHLWILFAVIPISVLTLLIGFFHHRKGYISALGVVGIAMLIVGVTLGHDIGNAWFEPTATVLGSVLLALGHFKNITQRKLVPPSNIVINNLA